MCATMLRDFLETVVMSTTTIRITDDLKARIHNVAKAQGVSAHALIIEAIAEKADCEERRMAFVNSASHRMAGIAQSGETIPWTAMRQYLKARVSNQSVEQPKAGKLVASSGKN